MKESLSLIQVVDYTVVKECLSVNKVIDCFSVDCIPVKERLSVIQVVDCTPVKEGLYCDSSCRLFFSLKECLSVIVPGENINSPNLNLQPFFFYSYSENTTCSEKIMARAFNRRMYKLEKVMMKNSCFQIITQEHDCFIITP